MLIAYALGVVITFVTIVISSRRISCLNVVAAIRDIPENGNGKRHLRTLFWCDPDAGRRRQHSWAWGRQGIVLLMGASLAIRAAVVARYAGVPSRVVFSLTGLLVLVLWLLPESVGSKVWGDLEQGIEMFFLAGIFMVVGATMVIVQNLDFLLKGVSSIGWPSARSCPR